MKKKIAKFSIIPVIAASIFLSFSPKESLRVEEAFLSKYHTGEEVYDYTVALAPDDYDENEVIKPFPRLGKSYLAFREALGFKESGGDYSVVNDFGYIGKYQFGRGTLQLIGIKDTISFLNTPELQEAAFYANASRNKWILRRDIARSEGKIINGVKITESGILAAAHLAGPGNVKKYLRSDGVTSFNDGFGTSIKFYFKKFGDYDTSFVKPDRKAKARIKNPSAV